MQFLLYKFFKIYIGYNDFAAHVKNSEKNIETTRNFFKDLFLINVCIDFS